MIVVRCKQCNKEITSSDTQTRSCGCPNMMTVIGDSITASNLSQTIIVRRINEKGTHINICDCKLGDIGEITSCQNTVW